MRLKLCGLKTSGALNVFCRPFRYGGSFRTRRLPPRRWCRPKCEQGLAPWLACAPEMLPCQSPDGGRARSTREVRTLVGRLAFRFMSQTPRSASAEGTREAIVGSAAAPRWG